MRLLVTAGGLARLSGLGVAELMRLRGLKWSKASALVAAFGLARRMSRSRLPRGQRVTGPHDVARFYGGQLQGQSTEQFHALYLDAKHRVLTVAMVSAGTADASLVHPREVFRPGLRAGAHALVVVHNHPSGDPSPSPEDREITDRLNQVGQLLGVELLDHVVLGEGAFYSFAEQRRIALGSSATDGSDGDLSPAASGTADGRLGSRV
jgi:DNA repair protein RadC